MGTETGYRGKIGAAAGSQECDRVITAVPGPVQRVANRCRLARPCGVVDTGAAAHRSHRFGADQRGDQGRCGGGVPDAHIADDQEVGAGVHLVIGDPAAGFDSGDRFIEKQSVLGGDVAAGASHLVRRGGVAGRLVTVHRHIHHPHRRPGSLGEGVDRRTAGFNIGHHLGGDFWWIG